MDFSLKVKGQSRTNQCRGQRWTWQPSFLSPLDHHASPHYVLSLVFPISPLVSWVVGWVVSVWDKSTWKFQWASFTGLWSCCLQLSVKRFNTVVQPFCSIPHHQAHTFLLHHTFLVDQFLMHSLLASINKSFTPTLQAFSKQLSTISLFFDFCRTKLIFVVYLIKIIVFLARLWLQDQNTSLLLHCICIPEAEELRVQMDCNRMRNYSLSHNSPTSTTPHSYICSLILSLCLSLHRPFRQKGLLCKCTSE